MAGELPPDDAPLRLAQLALKARLYRRKHGDGPTPFDEDVARLMGFRRHEPKVGTVYFIRRGAFVKIGFSANVLRRIDDLQHASPEEIILLRAEPGTLGDERAYHRQFAAHRERREWFRLEGALATFLGAPP